MSRKKIQKTLPSGADISNSDIFADVYCKLNAEIAQTPLLVADKTSFMSALDGIAHCIQIVKTLQKNLPLLPYQNPISQG